MLFNMDVIIGLAIAVLALLVLSLIKQNRRQQLDIDDLTQMVFDMERDIETLKRQLKREPEPEDQTSDLTACNWGGNDYRE